MVIIPAVDVLDGEVVRLLRGSFERTTRYGSDPIAAALSWVEAGADLVHVVDLEGARTGDPNPALWAQLAQAGVPFQVGGGIRRAEIARQALEAGARRVVMGSAAVEQASELARVGQPERVIAALDVADGAARDRAWVGSGRAWREVLAGLKEAGVVRVMVTAIDRDGTLSGPDWDMLDEVQEVSSGIGLIASGGIGRLADISRLAGRGFEAVVIGRALYENRFSLAEAIAAAGGGQKSREKHA